MKQLLLTLAVVATLVVAARADQAQPIAHASTWTAVASSPSLLALLESLGQTQVPVVSVTTVALTPAAAVVDDTVRLADVAKLPAGCALGQVTLCPAPLPGQTTYITRDQVELRLLRAGFRNHEYVLGGAGSVVITRRGQGVTADAVQTALTRLLGGMPLSVERLSPVGDLPLGPVDYRLRGELPNPLPDQFNLTLDVMVNGQVVARPTVTVKLILPAAPAAAPQAPLAVPPLAGAPGSGAPAAYLAPGVPAGPRSTWQVKRGDKLRLTISSGRVRVEMNGEARGQGYLGDQINVEVQFGNERRNYSARVVAPDHAVMEG